MFLKNGDISVRDIPLLVGPWQSLRFLSLAARGRKHWWKITWSSRLGVDAAGQPLLIEKEEIAKEPIKNKVKLY